MVNDGAYVAGCEDACAVVSWDERNELKVVEIKNNEKERMGVMIRLHCRNTGRSPARVERIVGYSEIEIGS